MTRALLFSGRGTESTLLSGQALPLRRFLGSPPALGPPQLGGFFPVAASVFQIQSVLVPTHEPLLIRWTFRSNHPVYPRGKVLHIVTLNVQHHEQASTPKYLR